MNKETENINRFPLAITYLETLGGDIAFTENYVGSTSDKNPYIISMNDFVVQFFDDEKSINFEEFYGLNNTEDFGKSINLKEEEFTIKILTNDERKALLYNLITGEKVKQTLNILEKSFDLMWQRMFYSFPPKQIKAQYINGIVGNDDSTVLKFSQKQIIEYTEQFIWNRIRR